jgi:hypothetical protein
MDQAAPGGGQGRVASGRALSARRIHRHQHDVPSRAGGGVLQPSRVRQSNGSRKARTPSPGRGCRVTASRPTLCGGCNCTHWLYNPANFLRTLALPAEITQGSMTTPRERLVKIGAKDRAARTLGDLPGGRGDGTSSSVPGYPDRHRGASSVTAGPMLRIGARLDLFGCQRDTCAPCRLLGPDSGSHGHRRPVGKAPAFAVSPLPTLRFAGYPAFLQ